MSRRGALPAVVDLAVIPVVNLVVAFAVAAGVCLAIGVSPAAAGRYMLVGALGSADGIGYTLYYATNFVFTGLAVAVAAHAGLFNIGGEGQATLGGLGAGLVALALDRVLPPFVLLPLCVLGAAAFGAAWAAIPAALKAYRGSHIVITTIMFNFIAAALTIYLLVHVLIAPGSMSPESRTLGDGATMPPVHAVLGALGIAVSPSPLNLSIVLAVACCALVWFAIWRTAWGYEVRVLGANPDAAAYAGIDARRLTMQAMCVSGALAGLVGVNEILGVQHRLMLNFSAGYGFAGIAVALMGRNHPVGIVLASLLFGVLYQGGAELAFEIPDMTRDMVAVMQGLVILFSGALANLTRAPVERAYAALAGRLAMARAARPSTA